MVALRRCSQASPLVGGFGIELTERVWLEAVQGGKDTVEAKFVVQLSLVMEVADQ